MRQVKVISKDTTSAARGSKYLNVEFAVNVRHSSPCLLPSSFSAVFCLKAFECARVRSKNPACLPIFGSALDRPSAADRLARSRLIPMCDSSDLVTPACVGAPAAVPGTPSSVVGPWSSDFNVRPTKLCFTSGTWVGDGNARSETSRSDVRMRCVENEKGLVSPTNETIGCSKSTSPR